MKNTVRLLRRESTGRSTNSQPALVFPALHRGYRAGAIPPQRQARIQHRALARTICRRSLPPTRNRGTVPNEFLRAILLPDCGTFCISLARREMIANSLIVTVAVLLALGFWLMGELKFLVPYRLILYHQYGSVILAWHCRRVRECLRCRVRHPAQVLPERHGPEAIAPGQTGHGGPLAGTASDGG